MDRHTGKRYWRRLRRLQFGPSWGHSDRGCRRLHAFSAATAEATLVITGINDRPTLDTRQAILLAPVEPGDTAIDGSKIFDLLRPGFGAIDELARGLAITGLAGPGTWEFSLDDGASCLANDRVRFRPNNGFVGAARSSFHAWEQATGVMGTLVSLTSLGIGWQTKVATAVPARHATQTTAPRGSRHLF